jgi:mRNA-degrading endonuclease YafQ of YafQ-DinJ toxin-antitoxin module
MVNQPDRLFRVFRTPAFLRALRLYLRRHPAMGEQVEAVVEQLRTDPFAPALRLHPLHGRLQGEHAVRITQGDRIVLTLLISEREIVLLDIGSHDELYRDR